MERTQAQMFAGHQILPHTLSPPTTTEGLAIRLVSCHSQVLLSGRATSCETDIRTHEGFDEPRQRPQPPATQTRRECLIGGSVHSLFCRAPTAILCQARFNWQPEQAEFDTGSTACFSHHKLRDGCVPKPEYMSLSHTQLAKLVIQHERFWITMGRCCIITPTLFRLHFERCLPCGLATFAMGVG